MTKNTSKFKYNNYKSIHCFNSIWAWANCKVQKMCKMSGWNGQNRIVITLIICWQRKCPLSLFTPIVRVRCSREWRVCIVRAQLNCQRKGIASSSHRHSFHLLNQLRVVDTNRKPNKYKARLTELRGWKTMSGRRQHYLICVESNVSRFIQSFGGLDGIRNSNSYGENQMEMCEFNENRMRTTERVWRTKWQVMMAKSALNIFVRTMKLYICAARWSTLVARIMIIEFMWRRLEPDNQMWKQQNAHTNLRQRTSHNRGTNVIVQTKGFVDVMAKITVNDVRARYGTYEYSNNNQTGQTIAGCSV